MIFLKQSFSTLRQNTSKKFVSFMFIRKCCLISCYVEAIMQMVETKFICQSLSLSLYIYIYTHIYIRIYIYIFLNKTKFSSGSDFKNILSNSPLPGGRSQDGGGVGWGEHFLPYKFVKRAFKSQVNSTKQLLNAGRGHKAPRKAAQVLERRQEKI